MRESVCVCVPVCACVSAGVQHCSLLPLMVDFQLAIVAFEAVMNLPPLCDSVWQ